MICDLRPDWRALALAAGLALAACSDGADHAAAGDPAGQAVGSVPAPREAAIARGKIEVQGGLVDLSPAEDGVVRQLAVGEGQAVRRGQLLLRLAGGTAEADVRVAESELRLARARAQARARDLAGLREAAARLDEAARVGAVQAQLADDARQALRDAEADAAIANAEVGVSQSRLAQARARLALLELRAPEDGTVVRVAAQAGARVAAGRPALVLLPQRPLIVRAELNESYVAAVRPGMQATVVPDTDADADAAPLPPAHVARLSPLYGNARLQDDAQRGPARVVECILEFDGVPQARVGQNVRVTFHE
ncbi:hypothetical protein GCM10023144_30030 [Pigmentiphaga soli]|uniref:HlyD family efflux transporter periplasmic adaptor subunit n=1 Tax=Pigmentiphaga soli TaxID=1007095 RepID=A0ABP8H925_9BURK